MHRKSEATWQRAEPKPSIEHYTLNRLHSGGHEHQELSKASHQQGEKVPGQIFA